ncbi:SLC2A4 regulator isoform X8 [Malaclemys terrapin pileata]|uniref:SLC2A4 regulator isoform X8 n=1 Tax=Malaclemys terrapin pileata TaxID=2991368 RepID=UPI0023A8E8BB|nr:SLC2A4 regulator isoform X8 [Malaclemys terrapin pileata]
MDPKRLPKRAAPDSRLYSPPPGLTAAGPCCPDCSPPSAAHRHGLYCGVIQACKAPASAASNAVYTVLVEDALLRRRRRKSSEDAAVANGLEGKSPGKGRAKHLPKSCNGKVLLEEAEPRGLTDTLVLNGRKVDEQQVLPAMAHSQLEGSNKEAALRLLTVGLEQRPPLHSAYIPVPRQRKLSGKAGIDEVMAAAVLTSLSTSPLVLGNPPGTLSPAEPSCEAWKEGPAMSSSYSSSSNNSGDWSWDPPSDRSTPSTPSPPLSTDVAKSFLPAPQLDDGIEETEATHFLFGDPIPRKRKNSTKVMFKCLWKSCGKVLSSSSGMQKHIRTVHLGRKADLDQSDGEEDFYYTELDVNVDSLTDGLSSLTPVSPTSSVPPAFPVLEVQRTPPVLVKPEDSVESPLSHSAPTSLCHVHTDHAYQVGHVEKQAMAPVSISAASKTLPGGMGFSISWQPPPAPQSPVVFKGSPGCLTALRPVGVGEKRLQIPHPTVTAAPPSVPKPATGTRKPRGEAKKCRKVYGMENRDMWCTACRWKKACQRFVD